MRSIGRWRVSTWLMVLWSGFWAFQVAALIGGAATACGKTDTGCQAWSELFAVVILMFMFLVWLVGLVVLSLVWAVTRRRGRDSLGKRPGAQAEGTPRGNCGACGAPVADVREACPRCGHSPQEGYDPWLSNG